MLPRARDLHWDAAARRRAVAELALVVAAPAVGSALRRDAACVAQSCAYHGEGELAGDRNGGGAARNPRTRVTGFRPRNRAVAELPGVVVASAICRVSRCGGAGGVEPCTHWKERE